MQPIASPSGLLPLTSLPLADPARYRAGVFCAPLPGAHGNSLTGLGLDKGTSKSARGKGKREPCFNCTPIAKLSYQNGKFPASVYELAHPLTGER